MSQSNTSEDECESKPAVEAPTGGNQVPNQHSNKQKKRHRRHTKHQIEELESFFSAYPYPDEDQRKQLGIRLGLDPLQIKFWFQNKRTQKKAQHNHDENQVLVKENNRLRAEQLYYKEAISNATCSKCGGPCYVTGTSAQAQQLRMENALLRQEIEFIAAIAATHEGKPITSPNAEEDEPEASEEANPAGNDDDQN